MNVGLFQDWAQQSKKEQQETKENRKLWFDSLLSRIELFSFNEHAKQQKWMSINEEWILLLVSEADGHQSLG